MFDAQTLVGTVILADGSRLTRTATVRTRIPLETMIRGFISDAELRYGARLERCELTTFTTRERDEAGLRIAHTDLRDHLASEAAAGRRSIRWR
jgi:hypothetical protein